MSLRARFGSIPRQIFATVIAAVILSVFASSQLVARTNRSAQSSSTQQPDQQKDPRHSNPRRNRIPILRPPR